MGTQEGAPVLVRQTYMYYTIFHFCSKLVVIRAKQEDLTVTRSVEEQKPHLDRLERDENKQFQSTHPWGVNLAMGKCAHHENNWLVVRTEDQGSHRLDPDQSACFWSPFERECQLTINMPDHRPVHKKGSAQEEKENSVLVFETRIAAELLWCNLLMPMSHNTCTHFPQSAVPLKAKQLPPRTSKPYSGGSRLMASLSP
eukprot:1144235-Pelagomonas_calceolata.AAC.6